MKLTDRKIRNLAISSITITAQNFKVNFISNFLSKIWRECLSSNANKPMVSYMSLSCSDKMIEFIIKVLWSIEDENL